MSVSNKCPTILSCLMKFHTHFSPLCPPRSGLFARSSAKQPSTKGIVQDGERELPTAGTEVSAECPEEARGPCDHRQCIHHHVGQGDRLGQRPVACLTGCWWAARALKGRALCADQSNEYSSCLHPSSARPSLPAPSPAATSKLKCPVLLSGREGHRQLL